MGLTLVLDLNYQGDALMSSPVFRAIEENTGYRADALVWDVVEDVLACNPYVGAVYSIPVGTPPMGTIRELRGRYDTIINLSTSLKWGLVSKLLGARERVGYSYKGSGVFNTKRVPIGNRVLRNGYRPDEVCDLLEKAYGWTVKKRDMILNVPSVNLTRTRDWMWEFGPNKRWVGIHTVVRNRQHEREWPREHWVQLCNRILEDEPETFLFFTGAEGEGARVENICSRVAYPDRLQNLCGITNFKQLAGIVANLDCLITVNTLPMHMAVALHTPVMAIVGGTPARVVLPNRPDVGFIEDDALENWNNGKYTPRIQYVGVSEVYEQYRRVG